MRVFVRVAQRASFSGAAEDLEMSRASVTKHVAAIEARHGVRLLDRTTRSVHVTEAGRVYLERCLECLQAYDDSESAIAELTSAPSGLLRVAGPFDLGRHMHGLVTDFMAAHPALALDVRLSNRTLDMVDEGIDVYLRVAESTLDPSAARRRGLRASAPRSYGPRNSIDADLVACPLAVTTFGLFGAKRYLEEHGRPRTPGDLERHRFAHFNEPPVHDEWTFERGARRTKVRLRPALVSNSGEMNAAAIRSGAALGVLPSILLTPEDAGQLEPVLTDWSLGGRGVYAVYPHRRFLPSKVRAFVDFAKTAFGGGARDPWWPASMPKPGGAGPNA